MGANASYSANSSGRTGTVNGDKSVRQAGDICVEAVVDTGPPGGAHTGVQVCCCAGLGLLRRRP